jgi:hypothetical protein
LVLFAAAAADADSAHDLAVQLDRDATREDHHMRTNAVRFAPASTTAIFIGWPICFAFAIPASMILCAFSIVIMTLELLIEDSQAAIDVAPASAGLILNVAISRLYSIFDPDRCPQAK